MALSYDEGFGKEVGDNMQVALRISSFIPLIISILWVAISLKRMKNVEQKERPWYKKNVFISTIFMFFMILQVLLIWNIHY